MLGFDSRSGKIGVGEYRPIKLEQVPQDTPPDFEPMSRAIAEITATHRVFPRGENLIESDRTPHPEYRHLIIYLL